METSEPTRRRRTVTLPSDGGSRLTVRILSGWSGALVWDVARSGAADAAGAEDSFSSVTTALATCCGALNCAGGRWVSCWTTVTLVASGKASRVEALTARSTLAVTASKPGVAGIAFDEL